MKLPVRSPDGTWHDIYGYTKCFSTNDALLIKDSYDEVVILGNNSYQKIDTWSEVETKIINSYIPREKILSDLKDYERKDILNNLSDNENFIKYEGGIALTDKGNAFKIETWRHYPENNYKNLIDIFNFHFYGNYTFGLKNDGKIVILALNGSSEHVWRDEKNIEEICGWENISSIAKDKTHVVGLKSNGEVFVIGDNSWGQCDVSTWRNVKKISCHHSFTAGLTTNGELLLTKAGCYKTIDTTKILLMLQTGNPNYCVPIEATASFENSHSVRYTFGRTYGISTDGTFQIADLITGKYINYLIPKNIKYYFNISRDISILVCENGDSYESTVYYDGSGSCNLIANIKNIKVAKASDYGSYFMDQERICYQIRNTGPLEIGSNVVSFGCGNNYFAFLDVDGVLHIDTEQKFKFKDLKIADITKACYTDDHVVYLCKNGTVGASGNNTNRSCTKIGNYENIVDIEATTRQTKLITEANETIFIGKIIDDNSESVGLKLWEMNS